ncbi:hypothetical protein HMPREF9004_1739 [Schaalia cardiffensis F0333]|uniref:Uncharacterized protein n=1 Tax=Schaalia cardiffensis F0333 TaxID=888050 RepID=N6WC75_9ACTO|nr:hypothetical protein HMPREF9004_1739 [Schaalia cardiffensis F0333]
MWALRILCGRSLNRLRRSSSVLRTDPALVFPGSGLALVFP